jgi:hypothetical protein
MARTILFCLFWLVGALLLYVELVALEFYWNYFDWEPILSASGIGLLCLIGLTMGGLCFLSLARWDRVTQIISFIACLALVCLGFYVLPREPETHGLFARQTTSPFWYRAGRLGILTLPAAFWLFRMWRQREYQPKQEPQ